MYARHYKGKYSWLKHLDFMVLDCVSIVLALSLAYFLKFGDLFFWKLEIWRTLLVYSLLLNIIISVFTGTYSGILRRFGAEELLKTALQTVYSFIVLCIFLYVLKAGAHYSRTVIILMYVFFFVITLLLRTFWKYMLRSGRARNASGKKTIFVIGERENMAGLLRSINSGFLKEYDVKGICIADGEPGEKVTARIDELVNGNQVRETYVDFENSVGLDGFCDFVLKNHIDEVFVGVKPSAVTPEDYQTLIANGKGIHMHIMSMVGFATDNQFITTVGTFKTLGVGVYSFSGGQIIYLAVKRLMDILFGLLGMIALLPLILVVKISYLATGDKKSVFYTQTRVGLNGKTFKMVKFRSMVYNAEEILVELLKDEKYRKEWEENQKFRDDPRITKMGRFLRKSSLDEIPQFINVLKGDMSLIGPRPLVPGELEDHNGLQLYNMVKPGISGWWGCNGRSNTTYDERLDLEYYYVKNCSLYLDMLCIIKTIFAILKKDGAK